MSLWRRPASQLATFAAYLAVAILVAAASLSLTPAQSVASPAWRVTSLGLRDTLFGLSCPATDLCVAVGTDGTVATTSNPTGNARDWSVSHLPEDSGLAGNLRGVSCPTVSLCVAVDFSGGVFVSTDPAGGASSWIGAPVAEAKPYAVSCPSTSLCVAVGHRGTVLLSTDPTAGAAAWTLGSVGQSHSLHAVSCPSPQLCAAVDAGGSVLSTTEPAAGASAWQDGGKLSRLSNTLAITCPTIGFCVAGNAGEVFTSSAPTAAAEEWVATALPTRFQVLGLSCPSPSLCAASTDNGELATSINPTGGSSAWPLSQLVDGTTNAFYGLSCPTGGLCVAVGRFGQVATSTNPFDLGDRSHSSAPDAPRTILFGKHRRRLRLSLGKQKAGTRFHFSADGVVTRFECKLDRERFQRCKAPRGYRLPVGQHRFAVRAVGPGGADRTPAVARVDVLRRHR